jgi:hypothetical protein
VNVWLSTSTSLSVALLVVWYVTPPSRLNGSVARPVRSGIDGVAPQNETAFMCASVSIAIAARNVRHAVSVNVPNELTLML